MKTRPLAFSAQAATAEEAITESLRSHCQNHCLTDLEMNLLQRISDSVTPNLRYQGGKRTETHIRIW